MTSSFYLLRAPLLFYRILFLLTNLIFIILIFFSFLNVSFSSPGVYFLLIACISSFLSYEEAFFSLSDNTWLSVLKSGGPKRELETGYVSRTAGLVGSFTVRWSGLCLGERVSHPHLCFYKWSLASSIFFQSSVIFPK